MPSNSLKTDALWAVSVVSCSFVSSLQFKSFNFPSFGTENCFRCKEVQTSITEGKKENVYITADSHASHFTHLYSRLP